MPVRNEGDFIELSLGAVLAQDYPAGRMEVIVVDGMSDDETPAIVARLARERPDIPVAIIPNENRIVPTGFNLALQRARGDIIVRVDGHCLIAPDYVRRCVERLRETGADNVGGLQSAVADGWKGRAVAIGTGSPFGVGNARFHYADEPGWADTVYLGAWPKRVFERIGGFDQELVRNQDDEFNFRLIQSGGRIWLDPDIRSCYYPRISLRKLRRQYYQYGFYKVRVIQKRGAVQSWRHLIPGLFVAALGFSALLSLATGRWLWLASVAGPYLSANAAASFWSARADWRALPLLPAVFATLHLAYGAGFLRGLWYWRGSRRRGTLPETIY